MGDKAISIKAAATSPRKFAVLTVHAFRCRYCGKPATEIDHIVPQARGGADVIENMTACCSDCNCSKSSHRLPAEAERELLEEAVIHAPFVRELITTMKQSASAAKARQRAMAPWKCLNIATSQH